MTRRKILGAGFGHNSRNAQGGNLAPDVVFPLRSRAVDGRTEFVASPRGAIGTDPSLGAYVRVHDPLMITAGSQPSLSVALGDSVKVRDGKLVATPAIADVSDLPVRLEAQATEDTRLNTLIVGNQVTLADHETRIGVLEALPDPSTVARATQSYTLSASTVSIAAWPSADTAFAALAALGGLRLGEASEFRLIVAYDGLTAGSGGSLVLRARQEIADGGVLNVDTDPADYVAMADGPLDLAVPMSGKPPSVASSGWVPRNASDIPDGSDEFTVLLFMVGGDDATPIDVGTVIFQTR